MMTPQTTRDAVGTAADDDEPVPLRVGGPCPDCGAEIEDLDFLALPPVAIKREMYDVCVLDTDALPTPWRHRTAIAYHEDPDPFSGLAPTTDSDIG